MFQGISHVCKGFFREVSRVFQEYFKVVFRKFQCSFIKASGRRKFQGCFMIFMGIHRVFQRCFKEVSRKLSRCFKKVSCRMALIAASRAEGGLVWIGTDLPQFVP